MKNGRVPGIYTDWPSAQDQITGWTKPRHKCFATRIEAQRFLDDEEQKGLDNSGYSQSDLDSVTEEVDGQITKPLASKRAKKSLHASAKAMRQIVEYNESDYEAGTGPLPFGADDGFDPNIFLDSSGQLVYKTQEQRQATKLQDGWGAQQEMLRIHTDGSSLGNGTSGAFAGIGVYFGPNDER